MVEEASVKAGTPDKTSVFNRLLRIALAAVLASYVCVPSTALAVNPDGASAAIEQEAQRSDSEDAEADGDGASEGEGEEAAADATEVSEEPEPDSSEGVGPDGSSAVSLGDSSAEAPSDLAPEWTDGEACIDTAGEYTLGADVKATKPLVVALPEGAEAKLDLAGHNVAVEGDAASAIDLAANKGTITFLDSHYDEKTPDKRTAISLKVENPKADIAAVNAVRSADTSGTDPKASFEHVRIAVTTEANKVESYGAGAVAVRTGNDFPRTSDEEIDVADSAETAVAFIGCEFVVEALSNVPADDLEAAVLDAGERGSFAAIDAGSRGVTLDNRTVATVKCDGAEAPEGQPTMLSQRDASYTIAPDFKAVRRSGAEEVTVPLTFGFPAQSSADNIGEAVVAKAEPDKSMPATVADVFRAQVGYDAVFDEASEDGDGYTHMSLVRSGQSAGDARATVLDSDAAKTEEAGATEHERGFGGSAPHVYASYLAANADKVVYASQITTQASGTDLNKAWSALKKDKVGKSGLERAYTITSGGTYYLSADLTAENSLTVNAPGKDVTINFNSHTLTLTGSGSPHQTMVSVTSAKSVTFQGAGGTLKSGGDSDVWAISSSASGCAVSASDLTVTIKSTSSQQRDLSIHAIRAESGTLSLENCTLQMLAGNQSLSTAGLVEKTAFEVPSAVYAASGVSSLSLTDCTVIGEGPSAFSLSDVSSAASIGNAYAVYSLASNTQVMGGSYTALSQMGSATCLYGTSLTVAASSSSSKVTLKAGASQLASGVMGSSAGGVKVNAPVSFSVADGYDGAAEVEAAFRASVGSVFVFGDCASNEVPSYPALVMTGNSIADANANNYYLGTFANGLSSSDRAAIVSKLGNALGSAGSCTIAIDLIGIKFQFDGSIANAVASVTNASGSSTTYYDTLSSAVKALGNNAGGTLMLQKNVGALSVSNVKSGTINLNNYTAASLTFSTSGSAGAGLTVKNGTIGSSATAVTHGSPTPLTLVNVTIKASSSDSNAYGVSMAKAAGKLTVERSTVSVSASRVSTSASTSATYYAYGIYMPTSSAGPTVEVDKTTISTHALTPGSSTYGICSTNEAVITDSKISASGVIGTIVAAWIGGKLDTRGSTFDVYTSDVATTASDIYLRTSNPKATDVSIDGCALKVRSAVQSAGLAKASYACVLGATSETGTSAPSNTLTLSGENTLACAGEAHIGMNFGAIALGSGFKLASGSDSTIVLSQAQNTDAIGISVADTPTSELAGLFKAKSGSFYDGWKLQPDAASSKLVWVPGEGAGQVQLTSGDTSAISTYDSFASAVAAAASGDTITLLSNLAESGVHSIRQNDLTLDLNGKTFTVRGGGGATAGDANAGGALGYSGSGTFTIKDSAASSSSSGRLDIKVGAATEGSDATYQGIAVSGGGTLDIESGTTVNVDYAGSTSSAAQQRTVTLRGIAVGNGSLALDGNLSVRGAASDGAIGAMDTYGIFAQPSADTAKADVVVAPSATVDVDALTAAVESKNGFYSESSTGNNLPFVREITVDPDVDADFYDAIVNQFRVSALYDNSTSSGSNNTFASHVYYAQNMQLDAEGKWYDGLKVWAYSDEVVDDDVGTKASIVPSHIFVSAYYDTLPNAYGLAIGPNAIGAANVAVKGSIAADCAYGNAYAVNAANSGGSVSVVCDGSALSAKSDDNVHPITQGTFDLRDFVDFKKSKQSKTVSYTTGMQLVRFESAVARDIAVASDSTELTLKGAEKFVADGLETAAVSLASSTAAFAVESSFKLASDSQACSVANAKGANAKGAVFAEGSTDASYFEDAYGDYKAGVVSDGVAWSAETGHTVTFKVGDAVVARYVDATSIDLSAPSGKAQRVSDQRQTYNLVGWSTNPDENAPSGYLGKADVLTPTADAVYYAVYSTGLTKVPVTFTNMHDDRGELQSSVSVEATYGQTVGKALGNMLVPAAADYTDSDGFKHCFMGWYPYSASSPAGPTAYTSEQVKNLKVDLSVNGVSSSNGLTLRAVYLVAQSDQCVVSFKVDDRVSSCIVDKGLRPVYLSASKANSSYSVPGKQVTVPGKTFTFNSWFIDSDQDDTLDDGESNYPSVLPKVTRDVTYTANWDEKYSDVTYTFYTYYYDEGEDYFYSKRSYGVPVETTTEKKAQEVADSVSKIGDQVGYGGKVYTLDGWSTRTTDTEPLYDADNPLPNITDGASSSTSYERTYYGVYTTTEHNVKTTFMNNGVSLGSVTLSGLKTVDAAFSATGAREPSDQSSSKQFLGWATKSTASKALDGISTTLEDVVGRTAPELTLYAVYGVAPTYTVRLRNADGSKTLYTLTVRGGKSVNAVLKASGKTAEPPSQTGKYFTGWRTAAGAYYSLDKPVTGSANLYASYKKISVTSQSGVSDANATVTTTLPKFEQAASLKFTIVPRGSVAPNVKDVMSENNYTALKCYDIRVISTDSAGKETMSTDEFGTAELKIFVGSGYKNSKVRVFWFGVKDGKDAVLHSSVKTIDSIGYITVSVGSYRVGDVDEGGNLCVGYIEGGSSSGSLTGSDGVSSGLTGSDEGGASLSTSTATLSSSSLALSSASGLALASSSLTPSSSNSSSANGGSSSGSNTASANGANGGETDGASVGGEEGEAEGSEGEGGPSFFEGWDSNAVVLILACAVVLAGLFYALWRLFVVRQRRGEDEVELPVITDVYAKGVRF